MQLVVEGTMWGMLLGAADPLFIKDTCSTRIEQENNNLDRYAIIKART